MSAGAGRVVDAAAARLGAGGPVAQGGAAQFASAFDVAGLAEGAVAAAAGQLSRLMAATGQSGAVSLDRGLACAWFDMTIRPEGWSLPPAWDDLAGVYRCADGWVRLHTNAPHHKAALFRALGGAVGRTELERRVAAMPGEEIESATVAAGGCAARLLSEADWAASPPGAAVAAEPLIALRTAAAPPPDLSPVRHAPLAGLRVLDLTRVLAGPVCTRFLAALGAQVLRIDPPDWDEPGLIPEVTVGKACARLDLRAPGDRATFERLAAQAHVIVHGYRNGAMEGLGYDTDALRRLAPGIVEVTLSAYGHAGPWAGRRGFDSLVQMSAGLAHAAMRARSADAPVSLPVQALDHATGYLMAAAALAGLARRVEAGETLSARLSLARVAELLKALPRARGAAFGETRLPETLTPGIERSAWGPARRLAFPLAIDGETPVFRRPAAPLGADPAAWPG